MPETCTQTQNECSTDFLACLQLEPEAADRCCPWWKRGSKTSHYISNTIHRLDYCCPTIGYCGNFNLRTTAEGYTETMSTGKYEEKLPCGGTLQVTKYTWSIEYYFSGPDGRYNGELFTISASDVEKYISALRTNWAEYLTLRGAIPRDGEFTKTGSMKMRIQVGGFRPGVCLHSYHMPMISEKEIEKVIGSYNFAIGRAPQIQKLLTSL